jgi:hypothetical protein
MINPSTILCDGCGLPASPQHIAERVERLERATRFRPVHMSVLFVALEPSARPEDDFYRPPELRHFFNSLLAGVDIGEDAVLSATESAAARLLEFQKGGYYLTFLSECPLTEQDSGAKARVEAGELHHISRLAPALIRRIRFNYRPKHVALLGENLNPLVEILRQSEIAPLLLLDSGRPFELPKPDDAASLGRFRNGLLINAPSGATRAGM